MGTAPVGVVDSGVAAKIVGVATTTTAAGVTAVVEVGEVHRVLVWLRAPPRRQHWSQQPGQWSQLWRRQRRAEEWPREDFQRGTARQPPPARLRPRARTTARCPGRRRQVSRAVARGASGPEAFNLLLRLLMTHLDRVDTGEGYTKLQTL